MARYLVEVSGVERPRVCYVPTATGDNPDRIAGFYEALQPYGFRPVHVALFRTPGEHTRELVLDSDIVYVAGGNTTAMLAVWRRFGFDEILREAWQKGILMSGHSAGAICWFEAYMSDSFGGSQPFRDGLGWLEGSCCTHYDAQPHRQPAFKAAVSDGFPPGFALEDGTGLFIEGVEVRETFTARAGAVVRRIELSSDGEATDTPIDTRLLTTPPEGPGALR